MGAFAEITQAMLASLLEALYSPFVDMVDYLIDLLASPIIEVPFLADLSAYFTVGSILAVLILRIGIGIKDGALMNGAANEMSLGEYIFRSCFSLVCVASAGMVTATLVSLCSHVVDDVTIYTFSASGTVEESIRFIGAIPMLTNPLALAIVVLFMLILVLCVIWQIAKRWVHIAMASAVAPLVAIYTATADSSLYSGLLKEIFSLGIINAIQILLLKFSLVALCTAGAVGGSYSPLVALVLLGFTFSVPQVFQRYALPSGSAIGRSGVYAAMAGRGIVKAVAK
jgi:hypothetical protein